MMQGIGSIVSTNDGIKSYKTKLVFRRIAFFRFAIKILVLQINSTDSK